MGKRMTEHNLAKLFAEADAAGRVAGNAVTPTPMIVVERGDPLDDKSPIVRQYAPVLEGVCGFARITIRPGQCAAARHAQAHLGGSPGCYGGIELYVEKYGQSMERKRAYASAYAGTLRAAGVRAESDYRMD